MEENNNIAQSDKIKDKLKIYSIFLCVVFNNITYNTITFPKYMNVTATLKDGS